MYIDLATNSPSMVRKLHQICAERGVAYIDAPVSKGSGPDAADLGMLTVMVGGDLDTLDRVRPVLNAIADPSRIFHCGPVGSGAVCKLCNNLVSHTTFGVLAEALTIGLKAGVPLETLSMVMAAGSASSPKIGRFESVFDRDFDPAGFRVRKIGCEGCAARNGACEGGGCPGGYRGCRRPEVCCCRSRGNRSPRRIGDCSGAGRAGAG